MDLSEVPGTSGISASASKNEKKNCDICGIVEKNQLMYGEFIEKMGFSLHYFCLLSGTHFSQQGKADNSGIYGFLKADIRYGIETSKSKTCCYCKKKSAAVECAELGCRRKFHFICGFKNNCVTEFIDEFNSYCHEHVRLGNNFKHQPDDLCAICFEPMGKYNPTSSIMPSCCNYGFFHKNCMIRAAMEAGYYTNCPFCADKNDEFNFLDEIRYRGVFIPQRDATWEQEKDAYADLVKSKCVSENCKYPEKWAKRGEFQIVTCIVCGCLPMHVRCTKTTAEKYHCTECINKTFLNLFHS